MSYGGQESQDGSGSQMDSAATITCPACGNVLTHDGLCLSCDTFLGQLRHRVSKALWYLTGREVFRR